MSNEFIDLGRTFSEINSESEFENKDSSEFYDFFQYSNNSSWYDLISSDDVIVILGEAGSGKSTEFKNQSQYFKKEKGYSFFIELENLIGKSDSTVLDPDFENQFFDWERGSEKAYFFLDSIDESKFTQRSDFKKAIHNFKRLVGKDNLDRCKIILSSRFSEWHPTTDVKLIEELIPEKKGELRKEKFKELKSNSPKAQPKIFKELSINEEAEKKLSIYRLNPLEVSQVRQLADHHLAENTDDFIESINASHAWSLAKRPLDVEGLIYIWKEKGKLGSFKDILEYHIRNGLKETPERQGTDQLSLERALNGVKCLAAAVLLTKRQKFYPAELVIEPDETKALLPQSCLPDDWNEKEIKFLLQRRLFDNATFSTIKFHLRSITDYLAAQWFKDRLDSDEDYLSVQTIFFKREEIDLVIKDSFKPILAWIAIGDRPWNEKVRQDILKSFPELFLKYGDPSKLPTAYLLEIMKALRRKYGDSSRIYADDIVRSLNYIGKLEFAPNFESWLRDSDIGENFKHLLLRIALHSEMKGLNDICKTIITDKNFFPRTRIIAIHYVGRLGNQNSLNSIKEYLLTEEDIENRIIAAAIEAFYPKHISNDELLTFLKKTKEIKDHSVGIEYQLKKHIEAVASSLSIEQLKTLTLNLITLIKELPHEGFLPYSKKYYWVGDGLFSATKHLLKRTDQEWDIIAMAIYHLNTLDRGAKGYNEINLSEFKEIEYNPELRRYFFWYCYEMVTKARNKEPHLASIFGGFSTISNPNIKDIVWLIRDTKIKERRTIALKFVKKYWDYFQRPITNYIHFRKIAKGDKELENIFSFSFTYYLRTLYKNIKYKLGIYSWAEWFRSLKFKLKKKKDYFREQKHIYRNLRGMYKGRDARLLLYLASKCSTDSGRYSKVDLRILEEKYSKIVAWTFNKGVKKYWPTFTPELPQLNPNNTDGRTVIGFAGISLSVQDNELSFLSLSDEKAQQLVHYAVNELNGYPFWLEDLTAAKPDNVYKVIKECVDKEWGLSKNKEAIITVLSRIRTSGTYLIPLIDNYLLEKISDSNPTTSSVLKDAISILLLSEVNNSELRKISENKIYKNEITDLEFIFWLSVLNQIDLESSLKLVQSVLDKIQSNLLIWYSIWVQLDAKNALSSVQNLFVGLNKEVKKSFLIGLCANLESRASYGFPTIEEPDYLNPEVFQTWFVLVYNHVDPQEDIIHQGTYTPGNRDRAQDYRRRLLDRFIQLYPAETKKTIEALLRNPNLDYLKDQLRHRRESTFQVLADQDIWAPEDIPKFMVEHEIDPISTYDLYSIILKRLKNIKAEVERDEDGLNLNSLRKDLVAGDDESELRKYLTRQLKRKANEKYIVTAEEELNPEVEPDLRIHKVSLEPISIEIKWAQRWSGPDLFKKLKEQLVDQYLRAPNCNYGIYLIGFLKETGRNENWQHPETKKNLSFPELIECLEEEAQSILSEEEELKGLNIVSIDFN